MENNVGSTHDIEAHVARVRDVIIACKKEIGHVVVGQSRMINGLIMAMLARGHVLLEGVPGLAKTLTVKTVASVISADFCRIQFTPDLLPADLIGTMIYRQQTGEFVARKGPIFSNIILADEINRAPAKVQSALLEAMEENQVTIGDTTYMLPQPFFVLATQNPIEQEGTYPLPEAQLDRFMLKLLVHYPSRDEEFTILKQIGNNIIQSIQQQWSCKDIMYMQDIVNKITVDDAIAEYIVSIIYATREAPQNASYQNFITYGASPRASIYLYRCAKVRALMEGRTFVIPEDVKYVVPAILRHRIILTYDAEVAEMSTDDVVQLILQSVPVP